jgi:hypothetical protein
MREICELWASKKKELVSIPDIDCKCPLNRDQDRQTTSDDSMSLQTYDNIGHPIIIIVIIIIDDDECHHRHHISAQAKYV